MARIRSLVVALTLIVAACSASAPATTTRAPTTTIPPPSTTAQTTTTTQPPPDVRLYLSGMPEPLTTLVAALYAHLHASEPLELPPELEMLAATVEPGTGTMTVRAAGAVGEVSGTQVAVVTSGDDVILAVADPTWRIVGAKLARFGLAASYGPEPKFLFVVGSDARPGEDPLRSRADSLHIVAMTPSTGTGAIVGIPRDAYVTTPDGLTDKFTHVLSRRDADTLLETARNVTSLPIDGYVLTGFQGFVDLVNGLGGFLFDVPFAMADKASQAFFQPGEQVFDGAAALAFSRNRHLKGGDFTRSFDQGLVMQAALKAVGLFSIRRLPALLELLTSHASTDLDPVELLTMGASVYELRDVPNLVVDGTPDTVNGSSIVRLTDGAYATFGDLADGTLEGR